MKKFKYIASEIAIISIVLFLITLIIIYPDIATIGFLEGVIIWGKKVMPALLPFFILTKILGSTSFLNILGKKFSPITQKLYGVGGVSGYIYMMSIVSGYPVGAKLTSEFYKDRIINRKDASTIASFTSTSGPLFIIGSISVGLFNSMRMGILVLTSHYIGAILNGLIYRQKPDSVSIQSVNTRTNSNISESVSSSILSILTIGGFIALFYMSLKLLIHIKIFTPITKLLGYLGLEQEISLGILSGIIEVTSGEILLSKTSISIGISTIISTFLVSFGGLSIHAQAFTFLKSFDMPYSAFLLQKITHAILSTITAIILVIMFL